MMKNWKILTLLTLGLLLASCSKPQYKHAKKFTFDAPELESKLVYFCQNRADLYPMAIRAPKAHAYFITHNNHNADALMKDIKHNRNQREAMENFNRRAKELALALHRKFACTLVDTIDD